MATSGIWSADRVVFFVGDPDFIGQCRRDHQHRGGREGCELRIFGKKKWHECSLIAGSVKGRAGGFGFVEPQRVQFGALVQVAGQGRLGDKGCAGDQRDRLAHLPVPCAE